MSLWKQCVTCQSTWQLVFADGPTTRE